MDVSIIKASFFICLWRVSSTQYMPQMGQMPQMAQMMPQMGHMGQMMPQGMPPMPMGGMPSMMPGAMPMPIPMAIPQPKLPVVVMPFHSKNADRKRKNKKEKKHKKKKKKRKPKKDESRSSDEDESSEDSCSSDFDFDINDQKNSNIKRSGHGKHRREVLTPVISYVNKKGDVVYQKKIKNDKARDWLEKTARKGQTLTESSDERKNSRELSYREFKDIYKRKRERREHSDK